MNDLTISIIARLVDRVSGPAAKVQDRLVGIGDKLDSLGREQLNFIEKQEAAQDRRMQKLRADTVEITAIGYAFYRALKPAIDFEEKMAGVKKVVDFKGSDGIAKLGDDIQRLTTTGNLPMTASEIAEIVEAAGQVGVVDANLPDDEKREALIAFARDAAQMGVAFDISAERAGRSMALWRARLKLTRADTLLLGDAVNHLSNNTAAAAPDIMTVIDRVGAVGVASGLTIEQLAALSATFVAAAPSPEIAATGMKNFLDALTKGEAATDRQEEIYKSIGLDPEDIARRMHEDAEATINLVLGKLSDIPVHAQSAAISDLFGEESKAVIMPLLTNTEMLGKTFGLVGDQADFARSMIEEYHTQADTTANNITVMVNRFSRLATVLGTEVLPQINELLDTVAPVVEKVSTWMAANPELTQTMFKVAAGLFAFKVASVLVRWPLEWLLGAFLKFDKVLAIGAIALGWLSRRLGALKFAGLLTRLAAFRAGASTEFDTLATNTERATARMNRALNKVRLKAFGAGVMGYMALQNLPQEPDELKEFQQQNREKTDTFFRQTPGLSHLMEGYEKLYERVRGAQAPDEHGKTSAPVQKAASATNLEELTVYAAELKAEIAEIEARLAALKPGPTHDALAAPMKRNLQGLKEELALTQSEIEATSNSAAGLQGTLEVVDNTTVRPEIDSTSIDRAVSQAERLERSLSRLPTTAANTNAQPADIQARARGGSFGPGWLLTGEEGPELEYRTQGGYIAHHGALRRMASMADRLRANVTSAAPTLAAMSAGAMALPSVVPMGGMATQHAAHPVSATAPRAGGSVHIENVSISVAPVPGTDPVDIAREVQRELRKVTDRSRADLHDGGEYE